MIVLQGSGGPLATDYGTAAFTNVASAEVRQYLIDLAVEAAAARASTRSSTTTCAGPRATRRRCTFPGLQSAPDVAVARFVADTNAQLGRHRRAPRRLGVRHRRHPTRADRPGHPPARAARRLRGADGLPVALGTRRVRRRRSESGSQPTSCGPASPTSPTWSPAVVPPSCRGCRTSPPAAWRTDRTEVRAQIDAALAAGAAGFLLWNSGSFYTAEALAADTAADRCDVSLQPPERVRTSAASPRRPRCRSPGRRCRSRRSPGRRPASRRR